MVKSQKGVSLLEVVIAIGLLGIVVAAFIPAMMGATRSMIGVDERQTAVNLAESQMEYVKGLNFAVAYAPAPVPAEYAGYVPSIQTDNVTSRDTNIQEVTVIIVHQGREVTRLVGYKGQ
jgi:prepilin-type N-terminal cleavage/methylation domain-containing protein